MLMLLLHFNDYSGRLNIEIFDKSHFVIGGGGG